MKYSLLLSMVAAITCSTVHAQPGSLDTRFGEEGIIKKSFNFASRNPSLITQKDGKILASIFVFPDNLYLYRYNPDGSPDLDFATDGVSATNQFYGASGIGLQTDGKILVGGTRNLPNGEFFEQRIVLRRFLVNGTIDSTFGENGSIETTLGGLQQSVTDLILQDDGKILISGIFSESGTRSDIFVARFMSDGSADSSFGEENGMTRTINGYGATTIGFQKDGKIILAGSDRGEFSNSSRFLLARFTTEGIFDSSFGEARTGIVKTDYDKDGDFIRDIVMQPDDKMVVVGTALVGGFGNKISYIAMARYLSNGVLDPSFGEGGKVKLKLPEDSEGYGVDLQTNDKIVVCGTTSFTNANYVLARYLSDGTPDSSFGENSIVITDIDPNSTGAFSEIAHGLIIQPTGRIVVVGAPGLTLLGFEGDQPGIITKIRRWIRRNILNFSDVNGTASYYVVEQQNSSGSFATIASVLPNKNNSYSYDLNNITTANTNANFRIKAVYADGSTVYSDAIQASALQADTKVVISPNPASSIIHIAMKENAIQTGTVYIYDAMGNQVKTQSFAKQTKLSINISSLRQGHYRVVVNSNGIISESNFLKE